MAHDRLILSLHTVKPHVYSHHKVRTSLKDRTLDSMFPVINPSQIDTADRSRDKGKGKAKEIVDVDTYDPAEDSRGGVTRSGSGGKFVGRKASEEIKESECFLTSVVALRERVKKGKHKRRCIALRMCIDADGAFGDLSRPQILQRY